MSFCKSKQSPLSCRVVVDDAVLNSSIHIFSDALDLDLDLGSGSDCPLWTNPPLYSTPYLCALLLQPRPLLPSPVMAVVPAIVGAIMGSVLSTTLPRLLAMIGKNSDVDSILLDLGCIKATIGDHPNIRRDGNKMLNMYIEQLRELAYDIQDCTDRFTSQVSPPPNTEPAGRFHLAHQDVVNHFTRGKFSIEFGRLKERSKDICEGFRRFYGPPTSNSNKEAPAAAAAAAADLPACMTDAEEKLLDLLEISVTNKLKVITIAGFGGLGTSFLAKQFYDSENGRQFSPREWINAEDYDETWEVHEHILDIIDNGAARNTTSCNDGVIQRLQKYLENKRYLIVIENAKTEELRNIISAFSWDGGNGGRVIVTTTIQSKNTWCACGNGLSLVVDNTAQFLKIGELTKGGFIQDCKKFTDESLKVLHSNYESLCSNVSSELLLYFCMFPRNHPVGRDPLIRRWLSEGLISKDDMTAPDDAFSKLTDSNIIQPIQISKNGKVKRCQTHAMMHNWISRKDEFKKFITLFCRMKPEASNGFNSRRLSLHPKAKLIRKSHYDLSRLRTMAVFSTASFDCTFAKYKLLRVLDLKEFADIKKEHVNNICLYLLLLKYLSLGETVGTVPRKIRKLKHLETLDMRRTQIVTVPVEVIKLPSLIHLLGKFELRENDCKQVGEELVDFLENDSKLERLSGFVTHVGNGFLQLMQHMVSLKKVKIWCNSTADETGLMYHLKKGIEKFIDEGMDKHMDECRISIEFQDCSPECSRRLVGSLQPKCRLTSLKLRGKLTQFPQFNATSANIITEVCLSHTNVSWDYILASLNNVEELKYLKLVENNLGRIAITIEDLKGLERMCLVGVESLHNIDISRGALPYLVSLHILCTNLDVDLTEGEVRPGIDIERHNNLQEVALHHAVDQRIKDTWQNYATCHPNRPKVLFIEP